MPLKLLMAKGFGFVQQALLRQSASKAPLLPRQSVLQLE